MHKPSDKGSFMSLDEEPGSLPKHRMLCRQNGQGMEPRGIEDSEGMLVEQR